MKNNKVTCTLRLEYTYEINDGANFDRIKYHH